MALNWTDRIAAFSRSPSHFLSRTTAEAFLADLLRELRDDRLSYNDKVMINIRVKMEAYTFKCNVETPIRFKMFRDYNRIAQNKIGRPFQVVWTFVQIFLNFNLIHFY